MILKVAVKSFGDRKWIVRGDSTKSQAREETNYICFQLYQILQKAIFHFRPNVRIQFVFSQSHLHFDLRLLPAEIQIHNVSLLCYLLLL